MHIKVHRWLTRIPQFVIAAALAIFLFLPRAGGVREMQLKSTDFHTRAQPDRAHSDVAVVRITDTDYAELFGQTSPLDTATLRRIIDAAAAGRPAVIGIDLEIDDRLPRASAMTSAIPLVWSIEPVTGLRTCVAGGNSCVPTRAVPNAQRYTAAQQRWGVAGLYADGDGIIRHYVPSIVVDADTMPVFSTAVLLAAGKDAAQRKGSVFVRDAMPKTRERIIAFRNTSNARIDLSASELLRIADSDAYQEDGPLRNKIVLIGGDFRQGRDQHLTPLGVMAGVDIWAQVIDTELEGGGYIAPHWFWPVTLQLISVTIVILLFRGASLRAAVLRAVIALPLLAIVSAQLAFGSIWHALFFLPSMIVILFWELYDRASDYLKLLKQTAH